MAELTTFETVRTAHFQELEESLAMALESGLECPELREMAAYHLDTGGKRVRALLPLWIGCNLGADLEGLGPLVRGIEFLHNGTLVHDDLQDGDTLRRGQETVWAKWGAAHAINVGSAFYFLGMQALAESPFGDRALPHAVAAMQRVLGGQTREFLLQRRDDSGALRAPTLHDWEVMARGKTGALFGLSFRLGFLAAGQEAQQCTSAASSGELVGLLFQLQDDFLDLLGGKGRERVGSDIAEGKLSYPVVWCLEHGASEPKEALLKIVGAARGDTDDGMIEHALALLAQTGAMEASASRLRELRDEVTASEAASVLPGLAELILEPVKHAL